MGEYRDYQSDLSPWSPAELIRFLILTAAGLAAGCLLLNVAVTRQYWRPDLGLLDRKLEALRTLADRVDLVYLGTSRVNQGIEPAVFDAAAAEAGRPLVSFNLGVEDMKWQEYGLCLDELQRMGLPRLKWVVVEPTLNLTPPPYQWLTTRVRFYSRWETVVPAACAKWQSQRPLLRRALAVGSVVAAYAVHAGNLGVLNELLLPKVPSRDAANPPAQIVRGGPSEQTTEVEDSRRVERFARQRRKFPAMAPPTVASEPQPSPAEIDVQRQMFSQIERLGARPIAVYPPQTVDLDLTLAAQAAATAAGPDVTRLVYFQGAGPATWYETLSLWRDTGHLSLAGARVFSSHLARDIAPLLPDFSE
ncbi:MAG: hypothetical protein ACT4QC_03210 [Planctomycetaceae bacterium]